MYYDVIPRNVRSYGMCKEIVPTKVKESEGKLVLSSFDFLLTDLVIYKSFITLIEFGSKACALH